MKLIKPTASDVRFHLKTEEIFSPESRLPTLQLGLLENLRLLLEQKSVFELEMQSENRMHNSEILLHCVFCELVKHIMVANPHFARRVCGKIATHNDNDVYEALLRELAVVLGRLKALGAREYREISTWTMAKPLSFRDKQAGTTASNILGKTASNIKLDEKKGHLPNNTVVKPSGSSQGYNNDVKLLDLQVEAGVETLRTEILGTTLPPGGTDSCSECQRTGELQKLVTELWQRQILADHEVCKARQEAKDLEHEAERLEQRLKEAEFCTEAMSKSIDILKEVQNGIGGSAGGQRTLPESPGGTYGRQQHQYTRGEGSGALKRLRAFVGRLFGGDGTHRNTVGNGTQGVQISTEQNVDNTGTSGIPDQRQPNPKQMLWHSVRRILGGGRTRRRGRALLGNVFGITRRAPVAQNVQRTHSSSFVTPSYSSEPSTPTLHSWESGIPSHRSDGSVLCNADLKSKSLRADIALSRAKRCMQGAVSRKQTELERLEGELSAAAERAAELEVDLWQVREQRKMCRHRCCSEIVIRCESSFGSNERVGLKDDSVEESMESDFSVL